MPEFVFIALQSSVGRAGRQAAALSAPAIGTCRAGETGAITAPALPGP